MNQVQCSTAESTSPSESVAQSITHLTHIVTPSELLTLKLSSFSIGDCSGPDPNPVPVTQISFSPRQKQTVPMSVPILLLQDPLKRKALLFSRQIIMEIY